MSERGRRSCSGRGGSARAAGAFAVAALLLLAVAGAGAQETAGGLPAKAGVLPIDITADRLSADSGKETVSFEGNVVAKQGEVTLYSDRLFAEYSGAGRTIEMITAEGNVRMLHAGKEARAARAVFYNLEQRIVLSGGAELLQGENTLKGDTVTVFLRENRSVVTGGEKGRVRAIIHPQGLMTPKEPQGR